MNTVIRFILLFTGFILVINGLVFFVLLKFNFGTVVPFLIGLIFLLHVIFWQNIEVALVNNTLLGFAWVGLWGLFFAWLVSFVLFVGILVKNISQKNLPEPVQAFIVLGTGIDGDKPSPTLARRLDRSAETIKEQYKQTHKLPLVITTGGVGFGEEYSEAYVMAKYLHDQHGFAIENIKQEAKSTSTEENLLYSRVILEKYHLKPESTSIAIVTSDFHTIRSKAIAKRQNYQHVYTVASSTPLSIRANAWFREYFAFVSGWLLNEY